MFGWGTFGTGKHNFGYIPDAPEPPSDEWFEEHCPKCKYNHEYEEDGKWIGECKSLGGCDFEEIDELCAECECRNDCPGIDYMSKDQCEQKRGWQ